MSIGKILKGLLVMVVGITLFGGILMSGVAGAANEVVVGASISLTGKYADTAHWYKKSYELWRDQVNAGGGLLGKKVKLVIVDDQSEPTIATTAIEKLISADKADLLLGPYSSSIAMAVAPVTEAYKMLLINGGASALKLYTSGYQYVFCTYPGLDADYAKGLSNWIQNAPKTDRPTSLAVVCRDAVFSRGVADGAKKVLGDVGLKLVFEEVYSPNATDLTPLVLKIKNAKPDVIFAGTYYDDAVLLVRSLANFGYNPKVLFCSIAPSQAQFGSELGPLADGVLGESYFEPSLPLKGVKEFLSAFKISFNTVPATQAATGYAACQVIERSVTATKSLDNTILRDYIRKNPFETVVGRLVFDARGVPEYNQITVQWQNGQKIIIFPEEYKTGKFLYPKKALK